MAKLQPNLALRGSAIVKRYPGVVALDHVDFELRSGEVHVLFGENGAGKSTLISVLSGAQRPDAGVIELQGREVQLHSVAVARAHGVSAVFQEFSLAPTLTVAENLVLGDEPGRLGLIDRRSIRRLAFERLQRFGFELDPDARIETLSRAEQQMVEIAKAFRPELSVLILDEPTASLTDHEAEQLFQLVDAARAGGIGIVYVTHRMAEIERLADRITVLRDGKFVATVPGGTSEDELISLMTGRMAEVLFPVLPTPGNEALVTVENITTFGGHIRDVSFTVKAGEIVGLAGLVGSGKSTAARACFGLEQLKSGHITIRGEDRTMSSTREMLRSGVIYLTNDRKSEGLFLERPLRESITLPWLTTSALSAGLGLRRGQERACAKAITERMELNPPDPERLAVSYSGGNQQKALLGRALLGDCSVYLLDEPTVGVDVGARVTIYKQIVDLAHRGNAVVLVSSELLEILNLCHRAYVFSHGRISGELVGAAITEESVLRHMMHWDDDTGSDVA
jgi:ribose transport system ATP-binding protein